MENRKLLRKKIQELVKDIKNRHGFILHKRSFVIKERNNILQMISFDFPPAAMQCLIGIQPLYIPSSLLNFSFSNSLDVIANKKDGIWGLEEETIESDILEMSNVLENKVFPMFEKVKSAQALIEYIENDKDHFFRYPPYTKFLYLGFSFMYIGEYNLAKINFECALDETTIFFGENKKRRVNLLEKELDLLECNDNKLIMLELENNICNMRKLYM